MKTILTISLAVLYLTLSVGVNIIVHTCGGHSDTMVATTTFEDPCGCAAEMPDDQCCTTEVKTVQLDDDQHARLSMAAQPLGASDAELSNVSGANLNDDRDDSAHTLADNPPPPKTDLCITNSVFRI